MAPFALLLPFLLALLHIFTEEGFGEESRLQVWLHAFYAKIEPGVVWLIDKMLKSRLLSGTRVGRAILKAIAKMLWFLPHGVVIEHEAALRLIDSLPEDSHIAIGPCLCKIGYGTREEPFCTDMVIMYGAKAYSLAHPHEYRFISKDEAKELLRKFREHNLIHEVFACFKARGWTFVICNCDARYCIPTRSYLLVGDGVYPGPLVARVDESKCAGVDSCGVCTRVCAFGASAAANGKSSVDPAKCMGCGICVHRCPQRARSLVPREGYKPPKFLPIEHTHPHLLTRLSAPEPPSKPL
ncbi:MAG: 4Fe-4S binding protein [Thermofilaceae archaeon]